MLRPKTHMHAPFFPRVTTRTSPAVLFLTMSVALNAQSADSETTQLDAFFVEGRSANLIGTATAASQGSVGYLELDTRPFLRRGELLEVIPGVVITQHSGGGKANQYFLRGFNLDHGTDFSISVDGMPINMRSHAHGQGYSDLNFLIPEFVRNVDYTKGPFAADVGDFSAAGAARFQLFDVLPENFATLEFGENNYVRGVVGDSYRSKHGVTTLGAEFTHDDGPWELKDDLRRFSAIIRHTWSKGTEDKFSVTALAYKAKWDATDQVPLRAIESGEIDRFGYIDPTNGGETERASLSFDWNADRSGSASHFNAYAIYYRLNLYSDFTYFLDDPINGDQFNQRDRRGVFGFNFDHTLHIEWPRKTDISFGVQTRDDEIGELGLRHTAKRQLINTIRDDDVRETSAGVFVDGQTRWNPWLRSDLGLRADGYYFDVNSDNSLNSGKRTAGIVSPKVGLVFGPWSKTELYLNAGYGFHSNDARGTTIHVDPLDGETPVTRVDPLVRSRGLESGVRTSFIPGLVSTVSLWYLDLDSELVFVGDAGGTEASGATRRYGVEWANFYKINAWLTVDADLSLTHARYRDAGPEDRIANSISTVVTAGLTAMKGDGWFGSIRLRYFGEQPIIEDNSVKEPASTTVNLRAGWKNRQWEFAVSILNALNRKNDDVAYFYTSRLPREPADGVDDLHLHPAEPRTVRFTVTRHF